MKHFVLCVLLLLPLGCVTATAPTPPLAPGYTSPTDQQFGTSLAAARALANQATIDFGKLTPAQQATEANALHAFVAAINAADQLYAAYHVGQASPAQVQAGLTQVSSTQAAYVALSTTGGK